MAEKNKKEDEKYNMLKEFEGSRYSGMKVGASHKWYYDQGIWRERKVTPEEWDVYYETVKRRAGKAPEGSGAPVGTEYNWLIIAHQRVDKLDANSYMTCLDGKKFKVAHKRAGKEKWSITEKTQRKKVIQFLQKVIEDLEAADENEQVPYTVGGEQNRIYGLDHKTKTELYEMASEREIPNRSKMSREELLDAIRNVTQKSDGQENRANGQSEKLKDKTKGELYQIAKRKSIPGRSEMKKEELLKVLKKETVKMS
ncbi:hypothetical protein GCM10009122_01700 [Fulvivirga kasyanovii]|uniref:Transcription termination factor Rho n=1 Tax=Fulvivirga kasyanovii TaxID=396812 RepID=A0ABW9RKK6_9BACT|nr:Rho termination factor N-terminal domain-containing protein [Fulvivirga kasyanovii]MTI24622.1 transcription termination factor Rho [Fulvivirga kasyanovii]